jgi:hypothetical protein
VKCAHASPSDPDSPTRQFYIHALRVLDREKVPYLIGGGYAMAHFTGIKRTTKDLDLFVRPSDSKRTLAALAGAGYRTEYFYPFWIAKALSGDAFIDILYNSGNGICIVDDDWFNYSEKIDVHGYKTRACPPEEQLWSKAFVMDRDRFDGADIAHLILARGKTFDWSRLLRRVRAHERVLLAHLMLFGYIYPSDRQIIPQWVMDRLHESITSEPAPQHRICQGTNLAQRSYGMDITEWGYADARLRPIGPLNEQELAQLPPPG